jgi:hypothetical protein
VSAFAKGSVVAAGHDFMRDTYGIDTWDRILGTLSDDDRALVANARSTALFPVAVDGRVFSALVAERFEGNRFVAERELRRGGAAQADAMLNGVFSVFARLGTPQQLFGRAGSLISSVYKGVSSDTEASEDGSGGTIHIRGLGDSRYIAPWQCGWIERALGRFGSASPHVTERSWTSGLDSSDHLEYEVRF